MKTDVLLLIIAFMISLLVPNTNAVTTEIPVGVILDMGSWVGNTVHTCISMAISDFYALNNEYKTRVVLHTRDSQGNPLQSLSAALDLMEHNRVQAIIGPETFPEAKFLAELGEKAKVPILSFAPITSFSNEYHFLVQVPKDETTQVKGIAQVLKSFKWKDVILIYEDNDTGRRMVPYFVYSFQENNIHFYMSAISASFIDDQINEEFYNLMRMQSKIFVVHTSPSLASRIFLKAKELRMMEEGYAWIITDWTMNMLNSMDSEVIIESMQGVLGFKSYIPASKKLRNFTSRWIKEYHSKKPSEEVKGLNAFGIWAYDATWALAKAVEKVGVAETPVQTVKHGKEGLGFANIGASQSGLELLQLMFQIRFKGLSGDFQLMNGSQDGMIFEIVNLVGNGQKRVGFWTLQNGMSKEIDNKYPSSVDDLKAIIWPGDFKTSPKGWFQKLKITVPANKRFDDLVKVELNHQTNAPIVTGFFIDVFEAAIKALPYEVPYEYIPYYGTDYNQMIEEVHLQRYDAFVGDITITANRSLYVDFTLTYTDVGVGTIARIDSNNMWIFLKPLDADLWLTILAFLFLTGFVIWVIEHPTNQEFQGSLVQQIGTVFWFSFSTLVFAHREKLHSNLSRFVATVWIIIVLILTSSYTAILSSLLTVQQIQLASKGESTVFGVSTFMQGVIVDNMNFDGSSFTRYDTPKQYADALLNGTIDAIMDEISYIKIILGKYSADLATIDSSQSNSNGFAFVFQKGSPLVSEISMQIARLREEGILEVLENKWFKSPSSSVKQNPAITNPRVLGLHSFRGLFIISGISSGLALLIFSSYIVKEKLHVKSYILKILVGGKLGVMMKHFFPNSTNGVQELNFR